MRTATVVDIEQMYDQDGSVLYGETVSGKSADTTVTLNDGTVVTFENGSVTVKLPDNQIIVSSPYGVGLGDGKVVGSTMMAVGGAVSAFFPIGTIVGAILAAAGALISAFSNGKAARKANEEAGRYEQSNEILKNENSQLDVKILDLQNAIIKAKKDLGVNTPTVNGLGWCMLNCAKNQAKDRLKTAKEIFEELNKAQEVRVQTLMDLTTETERLFLKKKNVNYLYIGTGVVVFGALLYFISKKL